MQFNPIISCPIHRRPRKQFIPFLRPRQHKVKHVSTKLTKKYTTWRSSEYSAQGNLCWCWIHKTIAFSSSAKAVYLVRGKEGQAASAKTPLTCLLKSSLGKKEKNKTTNQKPQPKTYLSRKGPTFKTKYWKQGVPRRIPLSLEFSYSSFVVPRNQEDQ